MLEGKGLLLNYKVQEEMREKERKINLMRDYNSISMRSLSTPYQSKWRTHEEVMRAKSAKGYFAKLNAEKAQKTELKGSLKSREDLFKSRDRS